ncbi:MAG: twin-arginine translocase subunit TatC [Myxococcota bacterium]
MSLTPPPADDGYDDPPMTIWEHLGELRRRIVFALIAVVVAAGVSWEFREFFLGIMTAPFIAAWKQEGLPGNPMLHFQTPAAAFLAYFKLSVLAGVAVAAPVVFYQVWAFIAPGLYAREKKFVVPFVLSSSLLFAGGGYFGWRFVFPKAFEYLLSLSGAIQHGDLAVSPTVMMGDYIDFVTRMLLGFGLIFEIPLFIFFLSVAGIVNYLQLIRFGRWFIVASFLFAAILTPPDITSQVMMAFPMMGLYFLSIGLAYVFGQKPTPEQREAYRERKAEQKRLRAEDRARRKLQKAAEKSSS